jgi:hypothetical protein
MAGFPKEGKFYEIGHEQNQLAGPVSLLRTVITTRARAATSSAANYRMSARLSRKDLNITPKQSACRELELNLKTRQTAPALPAFSGYLPAL